MSSKRLGPGQVAIEGGRDDTDISEDFNSTKRGKDEFIIWAQVYSNAQT